MLNVLETLTVHYGTEVRTISLCEGDLAHLEKGEAADILVVSAFAGDYTPTPTSVIGALAARGLSVADMSRNRMELDLRDATACWLSQELGPGDPDLNVRRLLCFEPRLRGRPPAVIGDIFRALMTYAVSSPPGQLLNVAVPIIATGDQRFSMLEILIPLLQAAARWMALGAPIGSLRIVTLPGRKDAALKSFQQAKALVDTQPPETQKPAYDVFVSYSRLDSQAVDRIVEGLGPDARVFLDRMDIEPGASWQQRIWTALASCRAVLAVFSPEYLRSKVCLEEFAIAMLRRRSEDTTVVPVHLRDTELPPQVQILNLIDCREGSDEVIDGQISVIRNMVQGRSAEGVSLAHVGSGALAPLPSYVREDGDWHRAAEEWLEARRDRYVGANAHKLERIVSDLESGARMLINLGDYALLRVLAGRKYLNRYEVEDLIGSPPVSDGIRARVDALIGFPGDVAKTLHFGAVGLESAGVRFYGAYCLVLDVGGRFPETQVFERDSYELVFPPLGGWGPDADQKRARALKGTWGRDLPGMSLLKSRALLPDAGRLVTEGRFRDILLRGEEFIEVHFVGDVLFDDALEVRQSALEPAKEHHLRTAYDRGVLPRLEELVWMARRAEIDRRIDAVNTPMRITEAMVVR